MKRIQSACIMQTIRFSQKDDAGYSVSQMLEMNRAELEKYKMQLERNKTRYVIDKEAEQSDGSILICIRKEYNGRTDVGEYFS